MTPTPDNTFFSDMMNQYERKNPNDFFESAFAKVSNPKPVNQKIMIRRDGKINPDKAGRYVIESENLVNGTTYHQAYFHLKDGWNMPGVDYWYESFEANEWNDWREAAKELAGNIVNSPNLYGQYTIYEEIEKIARMIDPSIPEPIQRDAKG